MTLQPEPGSYHHGNLRAELLQRARTALAESGVDGLSLRQLARELGVSNAAPRRHFRDRGALLDALALVGFDELESRVVAASAAGDFRTDFRAALEAYVHFAVGEPALLELMFARKYSAPEVLEAFQRLMARNVVIIGEAQARGQVVAGDAEELAMASFAPIHGIAMLVGAGLLNREDMDTLLRNTITILSNGLAPTG